MWSEQNYDTRLLHSNLSFPLLKKLVDVGDPLAKRVFKEEIVKRILTGYPSVLHYLIDSQYFAYFSNEEINTLFLNFDFSRITNLRVQTALPLLSKLAYHSSIAKKEYVNDIIERVKRNDKGVYSFLEQNKTLKYLDLEDLQYVAKRWLSHAKELIKSDLIEDILDIQGCFFLLDAQTVRKDFNSNKTVTEIEMLLSRFITRLVMSAVEEDNFSKFNELSEFLPDLSESDAISMFKEYKKNPISYILESIDKKDFHEIFLMDREWDNFFGMKNISLIIKEEVSNVIKRGDKREIDVLTKLKFLKYLESL